MPRSMLFVPGTPVLMSYDKARKYTVHYNMEDTDHHFGSLAAIKTDSWALVFFCITSRTFQEADDFVRLASSHWSCEFLADALR